MSQLTNLGSPSVFITGSSTGIGAACALDLDERGFRVFAGVRSEADGERLRQRASARFSPVGLLLGRVRRVRSYNLQA